MQNESLGSPIIPSHLTFKKFEFHSLSVNQSHNNQTNNPIYLFNITLENLEFWDVTHASNDKATTAHNWATVGTSVSGHYKKYFGGCFWSFGNIWEFIGERLGLEEFYGAHKPGAPPRAHPEGLWSPWGSSGPLSKFAGCLRVQEKSY